MANRGVGEGELGAKLGGLRRHCSEIWVHFNGWARSMAASRGLTTAAMDLPRSAQP